MAEKGIYSTNTQVMCRICKWLSLRAYAIVLYCALTTLKERHTPTPTAVNHMPHKILTVLALLLMLLTFMGWQMAMKLRKIIFVLRIELKPIESLINL